MTAAPRFAASDVDALERASILGVRSGPVHKYTGVWVVVVERRVFVRSWNDKPTGWYRALVAEPHGSITYTARRGAPATELEIRALPVRSARIRSAVTAAYADKYPTPASQKWVNGFAEPQREATTLELVPA